MYTSTSLYILYESYKAYYNMYMKESMEAEAIVH